MQRERRKREIIPTDFSTPANWNAYNYFSNQREVNVHYNAEIKKRSKVKGKYLKMYVYSEKFSAPMSLSLFLFLDVCECKITRFSYRSGNITKRMEFMHPRVRTTSAFEREKSTEVISPLFRVRQTLLAFPPWHKSFSFPNPFPNPLTAYLFHPSFPFSLSFFLLIPR